MEIEGNSAIETEQLKLGLKQAGLAEGYVFKRSTMERLELELERQYVSQGRYDAQIETEVKKLPRNRVGLKINVDEGSVASISHINIVGQENFTQDELIKQFELTTTNLWSWYKSDDKYSKMHTINEFEFTNQNGKKIDNNDVLGKIHIADFFFTTCPGICPILAKNMGKVQELYQNDEDIILLSYSVMPWIDTVEKIKEYASEKNIIDNKWHLLTGDKNEIYNLARTSYSVSYTHLTLPTIYSV